MARGGTVTRIRKTFDIPAVEIPVPFEDMIIPPLRQRKEYISALTKEFWSYYPKGKRVDITSDGIEVLQEYSWPGKIIRTVSGT